MTDAKTEEDLVLNTLYKKLGKIEEVGLLDCYGIFLFILQFN